MGVRDIIVIGASAGGLDALPQLTRSLPRDFPAAVFITIHLYGGGDGFLPYLLNKVGPLPAAAARNGEPVKRGRIYTAPPDYHLTLEDQHMVLNHGPKENMQRPCINTMFRSAAATYGRRVAGVLLTGMLDDGAAGLWEIQRCGGATIVQDPDEAPFPSMPESALSGVNVEYVVGVDQMGPLLQRLATEDGENVPEMYREPDFELAGQSCPACGGAMTAAKMGGLHEFCCHTGHRFGLKSLVARKRECVEDSIDGALAQSEELTALLELAIAESSDANDSDALRDELAERKGEQDILRALAGRQRKTRSVA
jgi:two-component system, chemotaxis family, protein-glutamate methylesterase/glutaminase